MPTDLLENGSESELDTQTIPQTQKDLTLDVNTFYEQVNALEKEQQDNPDTAISMERIEKLIDTAALTIDTIGTEDEKARLNFAAEISTLSTIFETTIGKGMKDIPREDWKLYRETLPTRFPRNYEYRDLLTATECKAFDPIPFDHLFPIEKERYIHQLAFLNHQYNGPYSGGCYWFGAGFADATQGAELLNQVIENKKILTTEEEKIVYEDEKNTFKIHLKVPPERKVEVLKAILSAEGEDLKIRNHLYEARQKSGDTNTHFTDEELIIAGCKGLYISKFKMGDGNNPNNVADFIFYSYERDDLPAEEVTKQIARDLHEILAPLNLPQTENLSRYSAPVIMNGERVPGMSFTQGNGDFKDYLRRHDPVTLERFYDRAQNYALRPGKTFSFDS